MRFLLDTNVLIPIEPGSLKDVEPGTAIVAEFIKLVSEAGQQICVHPLIAKDIERDRDAERRDLRSLLFSKYAELQYPPGLQKIEPVIGVAAKGTHDWVDHHLLAAIFGNASDYLVTEDARIHSKATRLDIADRVLRVGDAIQVVRNLFDKLPHAPPAVETTVSHALDIADPIFDSFRRDYPGFDNWLKKCQLEQRKTWTVRLHPDNRLAAVCIVNTEKQDAPEECAGGKTLKICSFKIAEDRLGLRLGELLLKAIFDYVAKNGYDFMFVTSFPKQSRLVELLEAFGFEILPKRRGGELVLLKQLKPDAAAARLNPLEYNVKYGPFACKFAGAAAFIVPVQPRYHVMLFPEAEEQANFLSGQTPFGNSIRKAYLCHSVIGNIAPGSLLLFYRSQDYKALSVLGVAEAMVRSADPAEIARFVGKRTVYTYREIEKMCKHREMLAIQFRQVRLIRSTIKFDDMIQSGILTGAPQSIITISEEGKAWIRKSLQM